MPRYTYRCESCGETLEVRQRMTDDPLVECPHCHLEELRRVINSVGIVFKGSGFYVTDNRGASKSGATSAPSTTDAKSSGESDAKSAESASTSSANGDAKPKKADAAPAKKAT
jgi:putative FmdB family regulatory protein